MKPLALSALLLAAPPALAHPHIFVDTGLRVFVDEVGAVAQVEVTWVYDALYSLLITEDYGMDLDGDAALTPQEEAALTGFDMAWIEGFEGDLEVTLDGRKLALSGPLRPTATMRDGQIVTTHRRDVAGGPVLGGGELVLKPYDPTYYTAYDVTLPVTVEGTAGCMIGKQEPDLNAEMEKLQAQLAELGRDQDAVEMGFPEVGAAFATEVRIACAPS